MIEHGGAELRYGDEGAGHPIVLVPSLGATGDIWRPYQVPALREAGHRCIVHEGRASGPRSQPPTTVEGYAADVVALIEGLDLGPVDLCGYSFGSFISQEVALARPDLVRRLALVSTLGRKDVFRRALDQSSLDALRSGIRLPTRYEAVQRALSLFAPRTLDDDVTMSAFLTIAESMRPPSSVLLAQQEAAAAYDHRLDALGAIGAPTLVIGFELDVLIPARLAREVAESVPGARYVEISGCGHGGILAEPDEVNRALIDFLEIP